MATPFGNRDAENQIPAGIGTSVTSVHGTVADHAGVSPDSKPSPRNRPEQHVEVA
jgi:hypothetical protein